MQGKHIRDLPRVPAQVRVKRAEGGVGSQGQGMHEDLWLLYLARPSARELSRELREPRQVSLSTVSLTCVSLCAFSVLICAVYAVMCFLNDPKPCKELGLQLYNLQ